MAKRKAAWRPPTQKGLTRRGQDRTGEDVVIATRRALAAELRKGGKTYREIGDQLGISPQTASQDVMAELIALRQQTEFDIEQIRTLELERCDAMLKGLWPKIKKGDSFAVGAAIKVLERRSKYLGLDAPERSEVTGILAGLSPDQVAQMSGADLTDRVKSLLSKIGTMIGGDPSLPIIDVVASPEKESA